MTGKSTDKIIDKVECICCSEKVHFTETWTWQERHPSIKLPTSSMEWICSEKCKTTLQL